jgi:hypothetical protein
MAAINLHGEDLNLQVPVSTMAGQKDPLIDVTEHSARLVAGVLSSRSH